MTFLFIFTAYLPPCIFFSFTSRLFSLSFFLLPLYFLPFLCIFFLYLSHSTFVFFYFDINSLTFLFIFPAYLPTTFFSIFCLSLLLSFFPSTFFNLFFAFPSCTFLLQLLFFCFIHHLLTFFIIITAGHPPLFFYFSLESSRISFPFHLFPCIFFVFLFLHCHSFPRAKFCSPFISPQFLAFFIRVLLLSSFTPFTLSSHSPRLFYPFLQSD